MSRALSILIVEDSEDDALLMLREIQRHGYNLTFERVDSPEAMKAALDKQTWDVVIADWSMPHFSGLEALKTLKDKRLDIPFIVVSGTIGEETAVKMMKAGAHDYLMKNNLARMVPAIERELQDAKTRKKHRQLESQLMRLHKMEALGQLARGVAHDFNNILAALSGYGNLLKMQMKKDNSSIHNIDQILALTERATGLTQNLLALEKVQITNPKPENLNKIIKGAEKLLLRLIGEDIELKMDCKDRNLFIMADNGQIEHVLINLTINAKNAMPAGGLLTIETKLVKIDNDYVKTLGYGKPGMYALVSVTDTGTGMDEETKKNIFDLFFTTKEVGKGVGLGLSIVHEIIKRHNGYINVLSEPGKGTTFNIYLPVIKHEFKETEPMHQASQLNGTETVLVAEDEAGVRENIKTVLEEFGYEVIEAVDGKDAIEKFRENKDRLHLVLLDVVMPKKNGKEVYVEISKIRPDLKTLFISGYTQDVLHQKGISEKDLNFLLKPVSPQELLKKVREVLVT